MIDIENQIIDKVYKAIKAEYPSVHIGIGYEKIPERFPYVRIHESDNYPETRYRTADHVENMAVVTYEIEIYSNKEGTGKSECKKIAHIVDDTMSGLNFTRTTLTSVGNLMDSSIHRMFGRYRACVDRNNKIYYRG